jgi:hypothetical protein
VSDVCPRCLQNPCYVSCLGPDELPPTYEELKAEVAELKLENERYRMFIQKIADEDYRGNSAPHRHEAQELLKTKDGGV